MDPEETRGGAPETTVAVRGAGISETVAVTSSARKGDAARGAVAVTGASRSSASSAARNSFALP